MKKNIELAKNHPARKNGQRLFLFTKIMYFDQEIKLVGRNPEVAYGKGNDETLKQILKTKP